MVKTKHRKTLVDLFTKPTMAGIRFPDIEGLIVALGGEVREGSGSRMALCLGDAVKHAHRPHPGKEAKKYQVEEIRAWLEQQGVTP
ncbi:MAG: type II toxin-antitoxin system HicA family toxin [Candidatus Desulfacyla sp.]